MAKPTTVRWTKLTIWPGDGASPEVFTSKSCGLTAKGMTINADTADSVVPDCTNPDAPSWIERVVRSLSSGVTGSGLMAEESFSFWRDWALSGLPKNVRVQLDLAAADGWFAGSYVLTAFELAGNEGDGLVNVTLTMASNGPVAWVAAP